MLNLKYISLLSILFSGIAFSQIGIHTISNDSLILWTSNDYYIYEFYVENHQETEEFTFDIDSKHESSIIKVGLANLQIDSLFFKEEVCRNEKILVRVFFKHIEGMKREDEICIQISNKSDSTHLKFIYEVVDEGIGEVKLFQSSFSKYLIVDLGLHQTNELILYDEDRLNFEHIQSRSRFLDLSFLEKGKYILEINNEEYVINKQ